MEHIKDLAEKLRKELKMDERESTDFIYENWAEIVGKNTAKNTKPFKIYGKKMFIYAENSVIMSEMVYKKKEIMDKVNAVFREEKIKEIIFRIKQ